MYQIIKCSRDYGADSGREFGRKADAVRMPALASAPIGSMSR